MRLALAALTAVLPWALKRRVMTLRGWRVDPTAYVGVSLLDAGHVELGPGARIGHANAFLRLKEVHIGAAARIGALNRFSGPRELAVADRVNTAGWPSTLRLGDGALIFSSNYLDVAGRVELGARTILAGGFSRIWSHDPVAHGDGERAQQARDVTIGADCYLGAGCTVLPGVALPERCTVGAASVLTRKAADCAPGDVLAGNPARTMASP